MQGNFMYQSLKLVTAWKCGISVAEIW